MKEDRKIPTWEDTSDVVPSWDNTEDVKKKEDTTSPSLEEPSTSGGIVSTPDQEFISEKYIADQAAFEPNVAESLSFQETEKPKESYMGLFNKKEDVKVADEAGVSRSFYQEVNKAAQQAERPVSFINESLDIKNRLEALPKYFPETARAVDVVSKNLPHLNSKNIDTVKQQVEEIEKSIQDNLTYSTTGGNQQSRNWVDYKMRVVEDPNRLAIASLVADTERLKEVTGAKPVTEKFGALSGVAQASTDIAKGAQTGISDYVRDYTNMIDDFRGNKAISDLREKLDSDEELTTEEKLLAKALYENTNAHNELDKDISTSYKIGEAVGQSAGFMGEFVLTGGQKAVGKAVLKGLGTVGAKGVIQGTKGNLAKFGVGAAVKLAQSGVQVLEMPSFYKKTAENVSNGMNIGEAFLDSYWTSGAEVLSERIFLTNPVSGLAANGTASFLRKAGINFNVDKGAIGVLKNTLEEAAEEKIGDIMTAPKDYNSFKDFWKGFTDKEQNIIMLGSVSLMTGGMGSMALAGNSLAKTKRETRIKRAEKFIPSDLRAEIDIITSNNDLSIKQQYDLIGEAISTRIDAQELGEDPATTTGNAMLYAQYKLQGVASDVVDENAKVENGELTVGEVQEVGSSQEQLDYLKEKGIEVPNGTTVEQLEKIYNKAKSEEDKKVTEEAIPTVAEKAQVETETVSQKRDKLATDFKQEEFDAEVLSDLKSAKVGGEVFEFGRLSMVGSENNFTVMDASGAEVGNATIDPSGEFLTNVRIDEKYRRRGIGNALYDYIESNIGRKLKPSPIKQSPSAKKFWEKRQKSEKLVENGNDGQAEVQGKLQEQQGEKQGVSEPEVKTEQASAEKGKAVEKAGEEKINPPVSKQGTTDGGGVKSTTVSPNIADELVGKEGAVTKEDTGILYRKTGGDLTNPIYSKVTDTEPIENVGGFELYLSKEEDGFHIFEGNTGYGFGGVYKTKKAAKSDINKIIGEMNIDEAKKIVESNIKFIDRNKSNPRFNYKPTDTRKLVTEPLSPEKGVTTPTEEKVAEMVTYRVGEGRERGRYGTFYGTKIAKQFPEGLTSTKKKVLPKSGKGIRTYFLERGVTGKITGSPTAEVIGTQLVLDQDLVDADIVGQPNGQDLAVAIQLKRDGVDVVHFVDKKNQSRVVSVDLREHSIEELLSHVKNKDKIKVSEKQLKTEQNGKEKGVQETQKEVTELEAKKVEKATGIKPKNLRDVYKAGREVFGLNRVQALAQAIIVDKVITRIAKNRGVTKDKAYSGVEYRKGIDDEFIDRVFNKKDVRFALNAVYKAKGAQMPLIDGGAVIYALTDPNVSTPLHEIAHVYEKYMTKAERDAVLNWTGDKTWTTETSEKFARGFEKYLATGKAPKPSLQKVFDKFKAWLTDIYNGITGSEIDLQLNDEMVRVYNAMLGEGTVRVQKTGSTTKRGQEYKEKFDDVDSLLFQSTRYNDKYDYFDKLDEHYEKFIGEVLSGIKKQSWKKLPIDRLKKIWSDYAKSGIVRDEQGMADIVEHIIGNVAKLRVNTTMTGHSESDPWNEVTERFDDVSMSEDDFNEAVADYVEDENGQLRISDYGLPKLEQYVFELIGETGAERQLAIVDKMLNVIHQRSDLAGMFVRGGSSSLSELSSIGELPKDILYQGEDKTEKHTQAVNKLIDNYEKEGRKDIAQSVRDYLAERGNPVSEEIINNVLKERGYAKENGKGTQETVQEEGAVEGEVRRLRVRDDEKGGLEAEEREKAVASRVMESKETLTDEMRDRVEKLGLKYKVRSHKSVEALMEDVFNSNPIGVVDNIARSKRTQMDLRVALGAKLMQYYDQQAAAAETEQEEKEYRDKAIIIFEMLDDELGREAGRAISMFNSSFVNSILSPRTRLAKIKKDIDDAREEIFEKEKLQKKIEQLQRELIEVNQRASKDVLESKEYKEALKKLESAKRFERKYTERKERVLADIKKQEAKEKLGSALDELAFLVGARKDLTGEELKKRRKKALTDVVDAIKLSTSAVGLELKAAVKDVLDKVGIKVKDDELNSVLGLKTDKEKERERKRIEQLNKEIEELDRKIQEGDISVGKRESKKESAEVERLKQIRSGKQKEISQMRASLKEETSPSEKLAQRIAKYVDEKTEKKEDPVAIMLNLLMGKFIEKLPKKETVKKPTIEVVSEAIKDRIEYFKAWGEARDQAIGIIEGKDWTEEEKKSAIDKINQSYDEATKFPFPEAKVETLVKEEIKTQDVSIGEVIVDHYSKKASTLEDLKKALIEKSGLTGEEANMLSESVERAFERITKKKKEQILEKYLKKYTPDIKGAKKQADSKSVLEARSREADELFRLSNIGAFDDPRFREAFMTVHGLPVFTEEQAETFKKLADRVSKAPEGKQKNIALANMLTYELNLHGTNLGEFAMAVWYANILSGASTQARNSLENLYNTVLELYVASAQSFAKGNFYDIYGLTKAVLYGYKKGIISSRGVLANGYSPFRGKLEAPGAAERIKFTGVLYPFNGVKYVTRIMAAADEFFYEGLKEMRSYELARAAVDSGSSWKFDKKKSAHIREQVRLLLNYTETATKEAKEKADKENKYMHYSKRAYADRVFEILHQGRGRDIVEESHNFAARGTFNYVPEGVLGEMAKAIQVFTTKNMVLKFRYSGKQFNIPLLKFIVPFTNIIANSANTKLDYFPPVGAYRAIIGVRGATTSNQRAMTADERIKTAIKAATGMIFMALMWGLSDPDEDGYSLIEITANGTGDYKKNYQLKKTGWRPYSIRIGDKWFSYKFTPLLLALAPIGLARDIQKYAKRGGEISGMEAFSNAMLIVPNMIQSETALSGVSNFMEGISGGLSSTDGSLTDVSEIGRGFTKTAENIYRGFVTPNIYKQIIQEINHYQENPILDHNDFVSRSLQNAPVAGMIVGRNKMKKLNVLGDEIIPESMGSALTGVSKVTPDPVFDFITKNNAFISTPSRKQTNFEVYQSDGTYSKARPMVIGNKQDDALWYKFMENRGRYIKEELVRIIPLNYPREEVQELVTGITRDATSRARSDIEYETTNHPMTPLYK